MTRTITLGTLPLVVVGVLSGGVPESVALAHEAAPHRAAAHGAAAHGAAAHGAAAHGAAAHGAAAHGAAAHGAAAHGAVPQGAASQPAVATADPRPPQRRPRPVVTGVRRPSGPVSGGVRVLLRGRHLSAVEVVRFGGNRAAKVHALSDRRLSVVTPRHAPGRVRVTVSAGRARSAASPRARYRYVWVRPALAGSGSATPPTNLGHSVALRRDGTVIAWGENYNGQLAADHDTVRYGDLPRVLRPFRGARAIAAGEGTTYAAMWDGTVKAVGSNLDYALGTDDYRYNTAGTGRVNRVRGVTRAVSVAAGLTHAVALRRDGRVLQWGANYFALDGTSADKLARAVPVPGIKHAVAVAASSYASFALREDGTVWAWGSNGKGELGTGDTSQPTRVGHAIRVGDLSGIVAIAAGGVGAMALADDGTVWTWGVGRSVHLQHEVNAADEPAVVPGVSDAVAISVGRDSATAVLDDGRVLSWGSQIHGLLGDGVDHGAHHYVGARHVVDLDTASSVVLQGGAAHQLVMLDDGRVFGWGFNNHSQLGLGADLRGTDQAVPAEVPDIRLR